MEQCPRCEREKPPFDWLPHHCRTEQKPYLFNPSFANDDEEYAYQLLWTGAL